MHSSSTRSASSGSRPCSSSSTRSRATSSCRTSWRALSGSTLLVIFGLLAGGALYGIPGVLVSLPTMAAGRAIWEFFGERIDLEPWEDAAEGPIAVDVELEPPRQARARREPAVPGTKPWPSGRVFVPGTTADALRGVSFPHAPSPAGRTDALRALVRETSLSLDDVVMPLFACPGEGSSVPWSGFRESRSARSTSSSARPASWPGRSARGAALRHPRGQGRRRIRRLGRRRDRPARPACACARRFRG